MKKAKSSQILLDLYSLAVLVYKLCLMIPPGISYHVQAVPWRPKAKLKPNED